MNYKKIIITGLAVLTIVATSVTAFAAVYNNSSETQFAYDEGLWVEFREKMNESKKNFLNEKVTEGKLTREEANQYYNNMLERQEYCRGIGKGSYGMMGRFGKGGQGSRMGLGRGFN